MEKPRTTKESLLAGLDVFIQDELLRSTSAEPTLLHFILSRTISQLKTFLAEHLPDDASLSQIAGAAGFVDPTKLTYDQAILEKVGRQNLAVEILEHMRKTSIGILLIRLQNILPPEGEFSPNDIRRWDPDLSNALKMLFSDWEMLSEYLPEGIRDRFVPIALSAEKLRRRREEKIKEDISRLGLEDVVTAFSEDPKKLTYLLQLMGFSETEADSITFVSFRGLRHRKSEPKLQILEHEYNPVMSPDVEIVSSIPEKTDEGSVKLQVKVPKGATHLYIGGTWTRDKKVNGEEIISVPLLLKPGENNTFVICAYDEESKSRTNFEEITIEQTSPVVPDDILVKFLNELKEDILTSLESDEGRRAIFMHHLEEFLIRKFVGNFSEGETHLKQLIASQYEPFIRGCLKEILTLFQKINAQKFPFLKDDAVLYFFQKYCIYKIHQRRAAGEKWVILSNEPGLGKTFTTLAATHEDEVLVVCPNAVTSTWQEEEGHFFRKPFVLNLAGRPYPERSRSLQHRTVPTVVTNVEYVRAKNGAGTHDSATRYKFEDLNARRFPERSRVIVIDEAHFLKNDSDQTEGTSLLQEDFRLLLSASPYRDPNTFCRVMRRILPNDQRFQSLAAFNEAFPRRDPVALKALHLLQQRYVIRFCKTDVLPVCNPSLPLEEQRYALPQKTRIDPLATGRGLFTLTPDQEQAIFELFSNWEAWQEKYGHYLPDDETAREDHIRNSDNQLVKRHALLQIMNDPKYVGSDEESPKHRAFREILSAELSEGRKIVVFCRYHAQVNAYKTILDDLGIDYGEYTGKIAKQGYKKDSEGREIFFEVDEFGNYRLDPEGIPIPGKKGGHTNKIWAMDYERLSFQNNPTRRVMLCTYSAGSVGVTFSAGHTVIEDDLPNDCQEQYQAEDRIHRIDQARPKYEARYFSLVSHYSQEFIERMREEMVPRDNDETPVSAYDLWFKQGTFPEVHSRNLQTQRVVFDLINDGIAADPALLEEEQEFNLLA